MRYLWTEGQFRNVRYYFGFVSSYGRFLSRFCLNGRSFQYLPKIIANLSAEILQTLTQKYSYNELHVLRSSNIFTICFTNFLCSGLKYFCGNFSWVHNLFDNFFLLRILNPGLNLEVTSSFFIRRMILAPFGYDLLNDAMKLSFFLFLPKNWMTKNELSFLRKAIWDFLIGWKNPLLGTDLLNIVVIDTQPAIFVNHYPPFLRFCI